MYNDPAIERKCENYKKRLTTANNKIEKLRKERDELQKWIMELEERNYIMYEEMIAFGVISDRLLPKKPCKERNDMKKTKTKIEIEAIIKAKLHNIRNNCKFKRAWIPENWSCVEVKTFAKELAEELSEEHSLRRNKHGKNTHR